MPCSERGSFPGEEHQLEKDRRRHVARLLLNLLDKCNNGIQAYEILYDVVAASLINDDDICFTPRLCSIFTGHPNLLVVSDKDPAELVRAREWYVHHKKKDEEEEDRYEKEREVHIKRKEILAKLSEEDRTFLEKNK